MTLMWQLRSQMRHSGVDVWKDLSACVRISYRKNSKWGGSLIGPGIARRVTYPDASGRQAGTAVVDAGRLAGSSYSTDGRFEAANGPTRATVQREGRSAPTVGTVFQTPEVPGEGSNGGTVGLPVTSAEAHPGARLALEGVYFRHRPTGADVLSGLGLQVAAGEIVGIVGRPGTGKTTLVRLIQRLCRPQAGRILIDDLDVAGSDLPSLRREISVVGQESMLFARSVRENIAICDPGMGAESIVRAARLAGAHEFILRLPLGYDTVLGELGTVLTACQRQRIAIARALATRPRILLLDQALVALEPEAERVLQSHLPEIANATTVIMFGHCLAAVREAGRILVLDDGRLFDCEGLDEPPGAPVLSGRLSMLQPSGARQAA